MIKAHTERNYQAEPIEVPFLWSSPSGCVYLRNTESEDIIIAPNICDHKVGKVVKNNVSVDLAWSRRLKTGAKVVLEQA